MQEPIDIYLDNSAMQQVLIYKKNNPQWIGFSLRVYIAGKGYDGSPTGSLLTKLKRRTSVSRKKTQTGILVDIIIDPETFKFVRNSTITWVNDERGKGFLVENPRHKKFRGKFFKRAGWEERLGS